MAYYFIMGVSIVHEIKQVGFFLFVQCQSGELLFDLALDCLGRGILGLLRQPWRVHRAFGRHCPLLLIPAATSLIVEQVQPHLKLILFLLSQPKQLIQRLVLATGRDLAPALPVQRLALVLGRVVEHK